MAWLLPLRPHTSPSLHSRPPQIIKAKGAEPEPFEIDVAQARCDLEANSNDLKAELRELYITSAKEVDVTGRKVRCRKHRADAARRTELSVRPLRTSDMALPR